MSAFKTDNNLTETGCPVCGSPQSESLYPQFSGTAVASNFMMVEQAVIDNRCCKSCGLIYNKEGTRRISDEFYKKAFKPKPTVKYYQEKATVTRSDKALMLLREMVDLRKFDGHLMDVGAGKGDFIVRFNQNFPNWQVSALEPNIGHKELHQKVPQVTVYPNSYNDIEPLPDYYDLMVSLSVLEHVPDPLALLKWMWRGLKPNGALFIEVPNFENLPNDVFCIDHLTKFTLPTLENLAGAASFQIHTLKADGVPIYALLKKTDRQRELQNNFQVNSAIADKMCSISNNTIKAVARARQASRDSGEPFAIFGVTSAALIAPNLLNFSPSEIAAYIDENSNMWGQLLNDRPVGGIELIGEKKEKHIVLATSPVYFEIIEKKLKPTGVNVYKPEPV